jgi:hypothetical protein
VDPFLAFIEAGDLSNWIRGSESIFAFPTIITLHTLGMASWRSAARRSI